MTISHLVSIRTIKLYIYLLCTMSICCRWHRCIFFFVAGTFPISKQDAVRYCCPPLLLLALFCCCCFSVFFLFCFQFRCYLSQRIKYEKTTNLFPLKTPTITFTDITNEFILKVFWLQCGCGWACACACVCVSMFSSLRISNV